MHLSARFHFELIFIQFSGQKDLAFVDQAIQSNLTRIASKGQEPQKRCFRCNTMIRKQLGWPVYSLMRSLLACVSLARKRENRLILIYFGAIPLKIRLLMLPTKSRLNECKI